MLVDCKSVQNFILVLLLALAVIILIYYFGCIAMYQLLVDLSSNHLICEVHGMDCHTGITGIKQTIMFMISMNNHV